MPRDILEAICNRLTGHPASRKCWFGLWGGYGWESDLLSIGRPDGVPVDPAVVRAVEADAQKPAFGPEVLRGPKLRLPFRNYMLFRGPREGADAFPAYHGQSIGPDLMWPRDRSWFIATDTDLDFTYVAGSHAVIGDLATDERLAAEVLDSDAPLEPDDR